ncbi:MAG: HTTM domain-containing protein [Sneathiella sp.]|nr:HTTM domain-containing protein [Sneathiella sp.]
MGFDLALRITGGVVGFAFLLQSLEYLYSQRRYRVVFAVRAMLSLLLLIGIGAEWALILLWLMGVFQLHRFQGPYNGGSDRMGMLVLSMLVLCRWLPEPRWQEIAFGYLGLQLILSYFISGWVKVVNPEWRSGQALRNVFEFSAYPVSETLRGWATRPVLLFVMSWAVILFELIFPLTVFNFYSLAIGLGLAATFHFANACLFGLNRFFWVWLSAYPALLWLQGRILGGLGQ